jgi:hypothetical protein
VTEVTGYIYEIHLPGLLLIDVITTPSTNPSMGSGQAQDKPRINFVEGSRLSFNRGDGGVGLPLMYRVGFLSQITVIKCGSPPKDVET